MIVPASDMLPTETRLDWLNLVAVFYKFQTTAAARFFTELGMRFLRSAFGGF